MRLAGMMHVYPANRVNTGINKLVDSKRFSSYFAI